MANFVLPRQPLILASCAVLFCLGSSRQMLLTVRSFHMCHLGQVSFFHTSDLLLALFSSLITHPFLISPPPSPLPLSTPFSSSPFTPSFPPFSLLPPFLPPLFPSSLSPSLPLSLPHFLPPFLFPSISLSFLALNSSFPLILSTLSPSGRHRCVGESFAYVQIKTIWSVLLRKYEFDLCDGFFPPVNYSTMIHTPLKPIIKYRRRAMKQQL